jgi:exonuclease SbcC
MIRFTDVELRDFGVLEQAHVELDGQGLVLIQGANHDTEAARSNGSGKSTIFMGLSWVLWGEIPGDGKVTTDIIRHGAKEAWGRVRFEDEDRQYRVERKRTAGGTSLKLYTDDVSTTGRTTADTEAAIARIIGLDWQAFRNTVLYGQGDINRFADRGVTDSARKAILKRILRLEVYDKALVVVREKLKLLRDEEVTTQMALRSSEAQLQVHQENMDRTLAAAEQWAEHQAERVNAIRENVSEYKERLAAAGHDPKKVKKLEGYVAQYDEAIEEEELAIASDRADWAAMRKTAQRLVNETQATVNEARAKHREALRTCQDIQKAILDLSELDICPTCHSKVDESAGSAEHLHSLQSDLGQASGEEAEAKVEWEGAVKAHEAAKKSLETLEEREAELDGREEALAGLRKNRKKCAAALDAERKKATGATRLSALLEAEQEALEAAETEENPHDVSSLSTAIGKAKKAVAKAKEAMEDVRGRMAPLKYWEEAFGNKGLPSAVMDNALPMIVASANRYLGILADGDITVDISTETELKGGGVKEEIAINLTIEGLQGVRPSGAQQRKVAIAVDLALMDLVADREGAQINMIMLDEVLDGLDDIGKDRVVELLRYLRTVRSSVFVISHDELIAEHFERTITVVKQGQKARIE